MAPSPSISFTASQTGASGSPGAPAREAMEHEVVPQVGGRVLRATEEQPRGGSPPPRGSPPPWPPRLRALILRDPVAQLAPGGNLIGPLRGHPPGGDVDHLPNAPAPPGRPPPPSGGGFTTIFLGVRRHSLQHASPRTPGSPVPSTRPDRPPPPAATASRVTPRGPHGLPEIGRPCKESTSASRGGPKVSPGRQRCAPFPRPAGPWRWPNHPPPHGWV